MKSVKLTKTQLAHLKTYFEKEQNIKTELKALNQALETTTKAVQKYVKSIEPLARTIDWNNECLLLDE